MTLERTAWCGELGSADQGREVGVAGWVDATRDHGGLLFVDLRDRSGILQLVFDPSRVPELHAEARQWRGEWVVAARGSIRQRLPENVNPRLATGEIELEPVAVETLARARPLPWSPGEGGGVDETLRLHHRYLDLRRPELQRNLAVRHRLLKAVRDFLDSRGFYEIETPMLTRSTPEGARDYLVPSRTAPGRFYALPQSPQLFKQLLMVAGLERYFQIARCFRDEDLRADRQPEFTQIDMEMSFIGVEDVLRLAEEMVVYACRAVGVELTTPFPRLSWAEARQRYGSDKPDLRIPLEIVDVSDVFRATAFEGFGRALAAGGVARALRLPGASVLSRRELDGLVTEARERGAQGLAWLTFAGGEVRSPIVKFLSQAELDALKARSGAADGDVLLIVVDREDAACAALGALRLWAAERFGLGARDVWRPCWVVDWPLLEWDGGEGRWVAMHHPFTAPRAGDVPLLASDPGSVHADAYDLVINGVEMGGGSIRIHQRNVQEQVFAALGISAAEARAKFGFLLDAFEFGAPPHGGIAFGVDRLCAEIVGAATIRDVIAFPKAAKGSDPLTGAPAEVDAAQLRELHVRVVS